MFVAKVFTFSNLENTYIYIWPRYSFTCPPNLAARLTDQQIVDGLLMRNNRLPRGALQLKSSYVVPDEEGSTRKLFWVDVDPSAIEYLRSVDFLLRTAFMAVRLKEAPRRRR